jgi:hypothetical protein
MATSIAHSSSDHGSVPPLKVHSLTEYHFIPKNKETASPKASNSDFIKKNNFPQRKGSEKEDPPSIKQITKTAVDSIMPTPKMQREQVENTKNHHPFLQINPYAKNHPLSSTPPHTTGIK